MKFVLVFALFFCCTLFAQGQSDYTTSLITQDVLTGINQQVEKEIPAFKKSISALGFSNDQIEFAIDTFRIEHIASKRMNIDYTTFGMNITMEQQTNSYDKLMNKYYGKLMKALKPEDKKVLITAEQSWMAYRDAENNLINMMTKDEYSGGGSIQTNIRMSAYQDLVIKRTIAIF
ncbi:MAG: lysozyme inhibitor LprI family protein, partial [Bacteroidia bacterium]